MRIGIDIRLIGKKRTGDEAVFFNLVKNLATLDGSDQYFLFTDRNVENDPALNAEIERLQLKNNFELICIKSANRFWWNLWSLPQYLRKNPVDIFHTQYIAPFWLPKRIKLVLTIHDISFNFFPQFVKYSDLFFLKTLIPRSLRMATKIIAVSEFTKKEIERFYHIPAKQIAVIQNGVDFGRFDHDVPPDELDGLKKKYNLPDHFILYIGTLQPRKNISILIEALAILRDKYGRQKLKLVVAGNRKARNFDPKIDEVTKKLKLQKSVLFPGWIDEKDKTGLFKLASCFVFPSLYEGFGIPIIEAMAAGTPVVSSNSSSLPEVGGDGAIFCDPEDAEKFAKKIEDLLSDENKRNDLVQNGKIIAKKFNWQKNAEEALRLYQNLTA